MTGLDTGRVTGRVAAPVRAWAPGRRLAVIAAALAGLLTVNLVIYAIGRALGGTFRYTQNGGSVPVEPVAITFLSLGPLVSALVVTAALARTWPVFLRIARIAGPVFAVVTIGVMTLPADFDMTSTVCLAAMHLVTIPAMLVAFDALARRRPRTAG